jgi:hypothetical protein
VSQGVFMGAVHHDYCPKHKITDFLEFGKKVLNRMELRMFLIAPCYNQHYVSIKLNPGKQTNWKTT